MVIDSRLRFRSDRTANFTESVIREMSRLAIEHKAVNLAQGFPDFSAPENIKAAARDAISADANQYSITWGTKPFRDAIARKTDAFYGLQFDPQTEVTVCCGSTEGMIASLLAVTNPGDEVIVFEPYYENYAPDTQLCGAIRRVVSLRAPDWSFDPDELRQAFTIRTKAIILNTPNNPTGKVFTRKTAPLFTPKLPALTENLVLFQNLGSERRRVLLVPKANFEMAHAKKWWVVRRQKKGGAKPTRPCPASRDSL